MTHHQDHDHDGSRDADGQRRSLDARVEDYRGRLKRAAGELLDDDELRSEGALDRVSADVKETLNRAVDRARGIVAPTDDDDRR
jgi:uncharacterized protein YjbJ (UPF0337 family)